MNESTGLPHQTSNDGFPFSALSWASPSPPDLRTERVSTPNCCWNRSVCALIQSGCGEAITLSSPPLTDGAGAAGAAAGLAAGFAAASVFGAVAGAAGAAAGAGAAGLVSAGLDSAGLAGAAVGDGVAAGAQAATNVIAASKSDGNAEYK